VTRRELTRTPWHFQRDAIQRCDIRQQKTDRLIGCPPLEPADFEHGRSIERIRQQSYERFRRTRDHTTRAQQTDQTLELCRCQLHSHTHRALRA
jgi:hypothetical protein